MVYFLGSLLLMIGLLYFDSKRKIKQKGKTMDDIENEFGESTIVDVLAPPSIEDIIPLDEESASEPSLEIVSEQTDGAVLNDADKDDIDLYRRTEVEVKNGIAHIHNYYTIRNKSVAIHDHFE